MAFEIIESFRAMKTAVHRFAGSGAELADQLRVIGMAAGTGNRFLLKHLLPAKLLFGIGRSDAVVFQAFLPLLADPVCGPGGR